MSGLRLGKYVLTERLAQGGMAEIFLATARGEFGFSRRVVVKRLLPHLAERPEVVQLFLDEARLLAKLHHPRVVQVLDLGSADGHSYQALEYLDGLDLGTLLARGPVSPELALRLGAAVAEALAYVHAVRGADGAPLRIVHGDVAPGNVVVTRDGEVKLIDFGVARWSARPEAPRGGTPGFIAPEVAEGGTPDCRSDLYALGRLLERMTAGAQPTKLAAALIEALTAPEPASRPRSADEALAVLNACLRELAATRPLASLLRQAMPERRRSHRAELGATLLLGAPARAFGSAIQVAQVPVRAAMAFSQQAARAPAQLREYARRGVRQKMAVALVGAGLGMGSLGFCSGLWLGWTRLGHAGDVPAQLRASDTPAPTARNVPPLPHRRRKKHAHKHPIR